MNQERIEKDEALTFARCSREEKYIFVKELKSMGCRLPKYWFEVKDKESEEKCIKTTVHVLMHDQCSNNCPIPIEESETVDTINELFKVLKCQPHLHIVYELMVELKSEHSQLQVSIVQPFIESGSLRDMIYEDTPTKDWRHKYRGEPHILPMETVKECGRHVLEAVCFLNKQGFPPLGHIHTGNIFQTERGFALGGYENTLLGYRTKLYRKLAEGNHLDKIDVIMFGHVIYEMSSGHVLDGVFPTEEEYERVRYDEVKELLHFIFNSEVTSVLKRSHKKMMKSCNTFLIKEHKFFQGIMNKMTYKNVLTPEQKALLALTKSYQWISLQV